MSALPPLIRFENFDIDLRRRLVSVHGVVAKLGGRAFDVLAVLVEQCHRAVGTNELMSRVWPNIVVEDNTLQVHISALRKALGPDSIVTIPGRGYQLAATAVDQSAAATVASATSEGAPVRSTLIARADELWAIRALVSQAPVITVVGSPGVGKTRLALEVLATLPASGRNAVLVELASLSDASLVPTAIACAADLTPSSSSAAISDLVEQLRAKSFLFVLDNCEHVLDSVAAVVVAMLAARVDVQILATSQRPLKVPGERVYRLAPLPVPPDAAVDDARDYGAVALFETRVRDSDPTFALTTETTPAAVEICQLLDGNPLALELAAARVRVLGVGGVRERLSDRFRLLTSGSKAAPLRQQTLQAAFDWSYRLLTEDEKLLFERLGAFVGTFSLVAAQKISISPDGDEWTVLDLLQSLIDRSLVLVDAGEHPRYRLLESGRAYALARLAERGTFQATMDRHAGLMRDLMAASRSPDFERAIGERLGDPLAARLELDDLRAALGWVASRSDAGPLAIQLAIYGGRVFDALGLYAEGFRWCRGVERQASDKQVAPRDLARFWLSYADLGCINADSRELLPATQRALELYRSMGDAVGAEACISYAVNFHSFLGEFREAEALLASPLGRTRGPRSIAIDYAILWLRYYEEDYSAALEAAERIVAQQSPRMRALIGSSFRLQIAYSAGQDELLPDLLERLRQESAVWQEVKDSAPLLAAILPAAHSKVGLRSAADRLFREGIPIVRRCYGSSTYIVDHLALHLSRGGRGEDAARLAGWSDHRFTSQARLRSSDGRRSRALLEPILTGVFDAVELEALKHDGRQLDDDSIFALLP